MTDDEACADTDAEEVCSIGHAAAICGVSSATIRMWERRYGRPVPVRLPSGHRRYTPEQVRWLKQVAEALAAGARASEAVRADDEELAALRGTDATQTCAHVERLVELARGFNGRALSDALDAELRALGPRAFLMERIAPFTAELGRAWVDGRLEIRHEHHASSHVDDLLRVIRHELPHPPNGPLVVLTTLPGEHHGLGLQMVATLAALEGVTVLVMGTETPVEEIVATARETGAAAVGIGVSLSSGGPETDRVLADLRSRLPDATHLVVGGAGARIARRGPRSIEYVDGLADMERWLRGLRAEHGAGETS